jgi:hypothetical protein
MKPHYIEEWQELYASPDSYDYSYRPDFPMQSSSGFTVISFPSNSYPAGSEIDFQVNAYLGYTFTHDLGGHIMYIPVTDFYRTESGWSSVQTFKMPGAPEPASSTPSPSPSPTVPEFSVLAILPLLAGLSLMAALLTRRKQG